LRPHAYRAPSRIAASDGLAASHDAGDAATPAISTTDTTNVTRSAPYAQPSPAYATTSPASAGPATPPIVRRSELSAAAAGRCSWATIRGHSESSAGRWIEVRTAVSAAIAYSGQISGVGSKALHNRPALSTPCPASVHTISFRLSTASASAPPYSPNTTSGTSSTAPIAPTAAADPVNSLTCTGSATNVRKLPNEETSPESHRSRKSREARQGRRSGSREEGVTRGHGQEGGGVGANGFRQVGGVSPGAGRSAGAARASAPARP